MWLDLIKFKLDCYNFMMLYVISITIKKTSIEYVQTEMRREWTCISTKISTKTNGGNEGKEAIIHAKNQ